MCGNAQILLIMSYQSAILRGEGSWNGNPWMDLKSLDQQLKKRYVQAIFLITSGKQISSNFAHGFNRINFNVILSYMELFWWNQLHRNSIFNNKSKIYVLHFFTLVVEKWWLEKWMGKQCLLSFRLRVNFYWVLLFVIQ